MIRTSCAAFIDDVEKSARRFLADVTDAAARLHGAMDQQKPVDSSGPDLSALKNACIAVQENGLDDELGIVLAKFARHILWVYDSSQPKMAGKLFGELDRLGQLINDCFVSGEGLPEFTDNPEKAAIISNLRAVLEPVEKIDNPLTRFHIQEAISSFERGLQVRFTMSASIVMAATRESEVVHEDHQQATDGEAKPVHRLGGKPTEAA